MKSQAVYIEEIETKLEEVDAAHRLEANTYDHQYHAGYAAALRELRDQAERNAMLDDDDYWAAADDEGHAQREEAA